MSGNPKLTTAEPGNGAAMDQAATQEIPAVSWSEPRTAAGERRKAFPYRFPRDNRHLGGKFSVAENARRLQRFFYFSAGWPRPWAPGPWRSPSLR